ncbi:MAG: response regulator transcription factor [bacterium]|nr:response regulator transcription factor [bacterium]
MTEPRSILLLEDDQNLGLIVAESLEARGYAVTLCRDGREGLEALRRAQPDLCLVDVMMPELDGFGFAREARAHAPDVPLIFLTARSLVEDRIEGFRLGADDYVTKPFSMEELVLRMEAVLRRTVGAPAGTKAAPVAVGRFVLDPVRQILALDADERQLTGRESELLHLLAASPNQVVPRSTLLKSIWGDDSYHAGRSMDVFVSRLRKHLADDPDVEIRTVHGKGLRLIVDD